MQISSQRNENLCATFVLSSSNSTEKCAAVNRKFLSISKYRVSSSSPSSCVHDANDTIGIVSFCMGELRDVAFGIIFILRRHDEWMDSEPKTMRKKEEEEE